MSRKKNYEQKIERIEKFSIAFAIVAISVSSSIGIINLIFFRSFDFIKLLGWIKLWLTFALPFVIYLYSTWNELNKPILWGLLFFVSFFIGNIIEIYLTRIGREFLGPLIWFAPGLIVSILWLYFKLIKRK